MMRAKVGSLLFVCAVLFLTVGPSTEGAARADGRPALSEVEAPAPGGARARTSKDDVVAQTSSRVVLASLAGGTTHASTAPDLGSAPSAPVQHDLLGGACAEGMVEVEGEYCPTLEQKCTRWLDEDKTFPRRCAEFAPTGACQGKTVRKHFCIDRYEFPNKAGEKPVVMKTWYDARDACSAKGKRLCGDSEWTLACEGQERLPYPYGHVRSAEACNIDKPHPEVNEKALANPLTRDAEVARLWQGEASGTRDACVSPFGAYDMTGNVDEWVVNESGLPYKSGLKGGYWGPVRDRCRPMTTAHYEQFSFYQIGFRCCADAPSGGTGEARGAGASPAAGHGPSVNAAPSGLAGS